MGMIEIKEESEVNHPKHYISDGMEAIDVIEAFTKDLKGIEASDTANIIKYALRWKNKGGVKDLEKLIWYADHLIRHLNTEKVKEDFSGYIFKDGMVIKKEGV